MTIHYGVKIIKKKIGLKLTRENYAQISNKATLQKFELCSYQDDEGKYYSEDWCKKQYSDAIQNFDLNMEYFKLLDHDRFEKEVAKFLKKNKKFKEVTDLHELDGKSGYYLMVLDEYCQLYIGISENIFRRIKSHWNERQPFDRLLLPIGNIDNSRLSIDSFRALDTTRLYVYLAYNIYEYEDVFINQISPEFCINRLVENGSPGLQALMLRVKQ